MSGEKQPMTPDGLIAMFGGEVSPIVMSPEEQMELERIMEFVEREGHQP